QYSTLHQLKQLHGRILKLPSPEYWISVASLLRFAAESSNPRSFPYAETLFRSLNRRSTFLYNTVIQCCIQRHRPSQGISFYKDMVREGLIKNNFTFTPLVKACGLISPEYRYCTGLSVHAHIAKLGFHQDLFIASALIQFYSLVLDMKTADELFDEITARDIVLWTCMIDGYGKLEQVEKAQQLFDEMPQRNSVSWSAIMAAHSRVGDYAAVLRLFRRMEASGISPNESSLVTAVSACARLGSISQGLRIHSYAEKLNHASNPILATALVDMYSKCGSAEMASRAFDEMIVKDSGAWNAIISGLATNGESRRSLQLFDEMTSSGVRPTETTLTAVLTACAHSGSIREGLRLFETARSTYGIEPNAEHYACVVDLLARSGAVEEAEGIAEAIAGSGDDGDVWGAILGACRVHGKVEVGDRA
ncbi:hypothetical protein M569_03581, partial [Genlisea aurea]